MMKTSVVERSHWHVHWMHASRGRMWAGEEVSTLVCPSASWPNCCTNLVSFCSIRERFSSLYNPPMAGPSGCKCLTWSYKDKDMSSKPSIPARTTALTLPCPSLRKLGEALFILDAEKLSWGDAMATGWGNLSDFIIRHRWLDTVTVEYLLI